MNEAEGRAPAVGRGETGTGDRNIGRFGRSSLSAHRSAFTRILVRGPNWIGDAVMCEPALASLHGLFPNAEVTLLAKPAVAELFRGHPGIHHILVYQDRGLHGGLGGKWLLGKTLRSRNFDLAILFQNAFEAAFLAFLAGIPRRYGYATDGRSLLLTSAIGINEETRRAHQVLYYRDLLRPLGVNGPAPRPRLYVSLEEEQDAERRLAEEGVAPDDFLLGVNPGSTYGSAKRWLPERFAAAADRLVRLMQDRNGRRAKAVLVGAPGEEILGQEIARRMDTAPLLLSGKTSIRELMAVTKRCSLFLTNDTGPMHIAAAFGVPVVAVFGPTDFRTTSPYGPGNGLVRHPVDCAPCLLRECPIDHRCMTGVTVEEVLGAAKRLLDTMNAGRERVDEQPEGGGERSAFSVQHSALRGVTVFLDRDGTINRDTGFVKSPQELDLLPGAAEAIARLKGAGAKVVLVTNQSGVARGLFSLDGLAAIHARLRDLLGQGGGGLDAIYVCPHHPEEGCGCRKPGTGLIDRAVDELGLDLSRAYVVGDQRRDMELARRVGARSVLVLAGQTRPEDLGSAQGEGWPPDHVAEDLAAAAAWILVDVKARAG